ncbi:MAG: hypothetical protein ACLQBJ_10080 [Bryobacteraceae bacterium]
MTLSDLFFLASVLMVLILITCIAVAAAQGRKDKARRLARSLGLFVAGYALVLIAVALILPRRFHAPGERRCFDDWCVAALSARAMASSTDQPCQAAPGSRSWVAVVEVSSVAKGARQRARDVGVELEDRGGRRYTPCAAPLLDGIGPRHLLSDELEPGGSFRVLLPFRLPDTAEPAGLVVHHGAFPSNVIIGDDQSFLHPPALLRIALEKQ